jgi:DNA-binding MarR family transcriptional regulator
MTRRTPKLLKVDELVREFRSSGNQDSAFDNVAASRLGINLNDLHCLNIIESRGGLTAGELATAAGLTTGAITGVVDRLERAGYARRVRDPGDRRKITLEVTPRFYARASEIWAPLKRDWDTLLARRFTSHELDVVIDFLRVTNEVSSRHLKRIGDQPPGEAG